MSEEPGKAAAEQKTAASPTPAPLQDEMTRAERVFVRINIVQTILAVAGVFTGAVALYAALNEADAVRKQQQASVWPSVSVTQINYGAPGEERFEIIVSNKGIGPARIISAVVFVDGEQQNTWIDVLEPIAQGERFGISNFRVGGAVLAPGESVTAVSIEAAFSSLEIVGRFRDLVRDGRANMVICYCSVFDDCWRLDAQAGGPSPVDACAAPPPSSEI